MAKFTPEKICKDFQKQMDKTVSVKNDLELDADHRWEALNAAAYERAKDRNNQDRLYDCDDNLDGILEDRNPGKAKQVNTRWNRVKRVMALS